jgi:hypothetical protein
MRNCAIRRRLRTITPRQSAQSRNYSEPLARDCGEATASAGSLTHVPVQPGDEIRAEIDALGGLDLGIVG